MTKVHDLRREITCQVEGDRPCDDLAEWEAQFEELIPAPHVVGRLAWALCKGTMLYCANDAANLVRRWPFIPPDRAMP